MPSVDFNHILAACASAFLAGAINSIAGGGTLISFPTLLWLGLPSITANATSTVAIWPGSLGSILGFRQELSRTASVMKVLVIPTLLGGGTGAILLRLTPASLFDKLVPFLILFATILFTVQTTIKEKLRRRSSDATAKIWLPGAIAALFLVALYGGYFGAGTGIMMLSVLGFLGMTDMLAMTALTSLYALCINGVAAVIFISAGMVYWPYVFPMSIAAIVGGYGAAGVARKIGALAVRRFVVIAGFAISIALLIRTF